MISSILLAPSDSLGEGSLMSVRAGGGERLALARVEGIVYALKDRCPHLGCPLSKGALTGFVLTCACHDWRFDVRDGAFIDAPEIGVETLSVFEENGGIHFLPE